MRKILGLMAYISSLLMFPDNFYFNTPNNHGMLGVINTPSARFYDAPAGILTFYRGSPDRKGTLTLYPYDWLEASVFYSSIKGLEYGPDFSQDYKDKGFNVKIRLKQEGTFPALALGFRDIGGTGYYSSEYLVSSYSYDDYDLHVGISWGTLNEFKHFKNPFLIFSNSFQSRDSSLVRGQGGKFNFNDFFSGEKTSVFAGLNYAFSDNVIFKLEYDPTVTPGIVGYQGRKSDLSFGASYLKEKFLLGIGLERGSNIFFNIGLRDNFFTTKYTYKINKPKTQNKYQYLREILEQNHIGVSEIYRKDDKLNIELTQFKHNYNTTKTIVNNAIDNAGFKEEILKTYKTAGLRVIDNKPTNGDKEQIYYSIYRGINQNTSLNFRPFIASREDFLKAGYFLEHDAEIIISENIFFSSNLKISLLDNFDDLIYPPVDTYPEQVRSDVKKYLNNLGEGVSIGRAQIDYFLTIGKMNHLLLSAGIYEEMFSGYGFEYLRYGADKKFNWGIEAHNAYKRDYNFGFGLNGYSNLTYHLNLFYKNREMIPFDMKVSFGEYLAGDIGTTVELSRVFDNGTELGVFASFTDVTFEQFGEGSFDKGIFFRIPFGSKRNISSFYWRPLTKDPASKLLRKNDLYRIVNRYSKVQ